MSQRHAGIFDIHHSSQMRTPNCITTLIYSVPDFLVPQKCVNEVFVLYRQCGWRVSQRPKM